MSRMPYVRLKRAPSSDCLHAAPAPHVGRWHPPTVSYQHTSPPASTRAWICSGTVQATSPWLTDLLLLIPDSGSWFLTLMTDIRPYSDSSSNDSIIVNVHHWLHGSETTHKKRSNWKSTGSLMKPKGSSQATIVCLSLSLPRSLEPHALIPFLLSAGLSHAPLCLTVASSPWSWFLCSPKTWSYMCCGFPFDML